MKKKTLNMAAQALGKLSVEKRLGNLSVEQRSEYFKRVRSGKSPIIDTKE